jgi:hypothetical protein
VGPNQTITVGPNGVVILIPPAGEQVACGPQPRRDVTVPVEKHRITQACHPALRRALDLTKPTIGAHATQILIGRVERHFAGEG